MVIFSYDPNFKRELMKIKDGANKERVKKKIRKVVDNPEVGKPMKYGRKGTREVYVGSYRLSYTYLKNKNHVVFLDLYHKDKQ